jgi:hypothetical protein
MFFEAASYESPHVIGQTNIYYKPAEGGVFSMSDTGDEHDTMEGDMKAEGCPTAGPGI